MQSSARNYRGHYGGGGRTRARRRSPALLSYRRTETQAPRGRDRRHSHVPEAIYSLILLLTEACNIDAI